MCVLLLLMYTVHGSLTAFSSKHHNYLFIHISLFWLSLLSRVGQNCNFVLFSSIFGVVSLLALPRVCRERKNIGESFNTKNVHVPFFPLIFSFFPFYLATTKQQETPMRCEPPFFEVKRRIEKKEYTIVNCCLINKKQTN